MAIVMSYACHECRFASGILDEAQAHADYEGHVVVIAGSITARVQTPLKSKVSIEERAAEKARDAVILREARKRNLLKTSPAGNMPSGRDVLSVPTIPGSFLSQRVVAR